MSSSKTCVPNFCHNDELSWLFTNRFSATRYMKVKRMGITEILRRIWLFSANKIKSSESGSKQPTQLIVDLNSSLQHIIVTKDCYFLSNTYKSNFKARFYNKEELIKSKERYAPFLSKKAGFCRLHK